MTSAHRLSVERTKDVDGAIHYFQIKKEDNAHRILCPLMHDLGLSDDEILVFDIPYEGLHDEYLVVDAKDYRIDLFITEEYLHLVIAVKKNRLSKSDLIRKVSTRLHVFKMTGDSNIDLPSRP